MEKRCALTLKVKNAMRKHMLFVLALVVYGSLFSQGYGEIRGRVLDSSDQPLPGAEVQCSAGADIKRLRTDSTGAYVFKPLQPGIYWIVVIYNGFSDVRVNDLHVIADQYTFVEDIRMTEMSGAMVKPLVVVGHRDLIDKNGGTMVSIKSKELRQMSVFHGGNLKAIVAALTSDIKTGSRGEELYFRGSRNGSVLYFIDGVKIRENVPNVPGPGISSIVVYTGGLPAKYGDTTGGVVVVETKSYLEDYYERLRENE